MANQYSAYRLIRQRYTCTHKHTHTNKKKDIFFFHLWVFVYRIIRPKSIYYWNAASSRITIATYTSELYPAMNNIKCFLYLTVSDKLLILI